MSAGLREALENLLANTDGWAVSNDTLRNLLAAHPVEPAPECAGQCYKLTESGAGYIDPNCPKHGHPAEPVAFRERAAQALKDVPFRGDAERLTGGSIARIVDALLAAGVFREPPTREQIHAALMALFDEYSEPSVDQNTDAVLALFGGDAK